MCHLVANPVVPGGDEPKSEHRFVGEGDQRVPPYGDRSSNSLGCELGGQDNLSGAIDTRTESIVMYQY